MPNEERTTGWVFSEHYLWHDTGTYNLAKTDAPTGIISGSRMNLGLCSG